MYVCMYVCMYIYIYVRLSLYAYIYICVYMCIHIYIYIYIMQAAQNDQALWVPQPDGWCSWSKKGEVLLRGVSTLRYVSPTKCICAVAA